MRRLSDVHDLFGKNWAKDDPEFKALSYFKKLIIFYMKIERIYCSYSNSDYDRELLENLNLYFSLIQDSKEKKENIYFEDLRTLMNNRLTKIISSGCLDFYPFSKLHVLKEKKILEDGELKIIE